MPKTKRKQEIVKLEMQEGIRMEWHWEGDDLVVDTCNAPVECLPLLFPAWMVKAVKKARS